MPSSCSTLILGMLLRIEMNAMSEMFMSFYSVPFRRLFDASVCLIERLEWTEGPREVRCQRVKPFVAGWHLSEATWSQVEIVDAQAAWSRSSAAVAKEFS